jgi:hypothetical protein
MTGGLAPANVTRASPHRPRAGRRGVLAAAVALEEAQQHAAQRRDVAGAELGRELGLHPLALGAGRAAHGLAARRERDDLGAPVARVRRARDEALAMLPVGGRATVAGEEMTPPWAV